MRQAVIFDLKAMFLALALVMPMVMMPVGAAQAQKVKKIGKVEIIKGKPIMVIEIDKILCEEKQALLEEGKIWYY